MDWLDSRTVFIIVAIIFWSGYIIYRNKKKPGIKKYWGFRTDNFNQTIKIILPFAISTIVLLICIGLFQKTLNLTWHILPLLLLYPIWGVIQQFLLIALTTGNLHDLKRSNIPKALSIILPAFLFGIIHYPFVWLIVGSFVLGAFYGWIYLKQRNIYVLGILHGWLGAFFFYTVVNRDPFMEVFGRLLNNFR
jgi:membrane protease YdiL (CAAX protease family)